MKNADVKQSDGMITKELLAEQVLDKVIGAKAHTTPIDSIIKELKEVKK